MAISRSTALRRLQACGIPSGPASQILTLFERWVKCSGPEWTVAHCKSLKVDLLRSVVGLDSVGTWIKRRKDGATPAGPIGWLWKIAAVNKRGTYRAWNVIMIYTSLFFSDPDVYITRQQYEKFIRAVAREPVSESAHIRAESVIWQSGYRFTRRFDATTGADVLGITHSPSKRGVIPGQLRTAPVDSTLIGALAAFRNAPDFYWRHQTILDGAIGVLSPYLRGSMMVRPDGTNLLSGIGQLWSATPIESGRIGFKQDAGYKLRHIAVPNQILQASLKPLGVFLLKNLRDLPEDVTHNQEQGVLDVQAFLRRGLTAYSFDLSSATDRFPLSLQLTMLRWLGIPESWVSLFGETSRGLWQWAAEGRRMPYEVDDEPLGFGTGYIAWTVGQPLGLYPSFASFALCHHLLVRGLFALHGKDELRYRILGDDIVIFDDEVAQHYQDLLKDLGVEISEAKSIVSADVAEFAGKVIFKDYILSGYKWTGICSDFNFLDVVRNLGSKGRYLLRLRQRKVVDAIAAIPEPWGLGFNPLGLPLSERMGPLWESLARDRDTRPRAFSTRSARIWRIFYDTDPAYTRISDEIPRDTSDQDVVSLLERTLGPRVAPLAHSMLPNLDFLTRIQSDDEILGDLASTWQDVQPFLSKFSFLEKVSAVSTLVKYERQIALARASKT